MKNTLLLLTALLLSAIGVQAQQPGTPVFKKSPASGFTAKTPVHRTEAGNGQWWGYCSDDSEISGVGINAADTYFAAISLTGTNIPLYKTLKGMRFAIMSNKATNIKVWVATALPNTLNDTYIIASQDVDAATRADDGTFEVLFDEPIEVSNRYLYVGYTFTISTVSTTDDGYPVGTVADDSDLRNAYLIKTKTNMPQWTDLNGNNLGRLYLQILIDGQFDAYSASGLSTDALYYIKKGETAETYITVENLGTETITDIDYLSYTILPDRTGKPSETRHAVLEQPIPSLSTGEVKVVVNADDELGKAEHNLWITKVNGQDNAYINNAYWYNVFTLERIIPRNVIVEEFTGLTCGWCIRGIVGMERMRHAFGDRFIGIAIHQYTTNANQDAMYLEKTKYASHGMTGAPSCRMDRKEVIDPYYGSGDDMLPDFEAEMNIPALADVQLRACWNADSSKVLASATVESLFDSDYKIEFVLIADSLEGTTAAWKQYNYYAQYDSSSLPEDLAMFGSGGSLGTSPISGLKFNDVAVTSSYTIGSNKATLPELKAGQPTETAYTLNLPARATFKNALKKHLMYVAVMIIDKENGTVINAAKAHVEPFDPALGIETPAAADAKLAARYSLDGRKLNAPQRGLNIIRMADGTTRKVMVK
jgi:hypothetical protein